MNEKGKQAIRVLMNLPYGSEGRPGGEGNKFGRLGLHGESSGFRHHKEIGLFQHPSKGQDAPNRSSGDAGIAQEPWQSSMGVQGDTKGVHGGASSYSQ